MEEKDSLSLEIYREAAELRRIGNRAVRKAQEKNRRLGIPNVYSHRGRIYFELPDGRITEEDPYEQAPPRPEKPTNGGSLTTD